MDVITPADYAMAVAALEYQAAQYLVWAEQDRHSMRPRAIEDHNRNYAKAKELQATAAKFRRLI